MNALSIAAVKRCYRSFLAVLFSLGLGCFLSVVSALPGSAVPIHSVPNPQAQQGSWVSDTANMISAESETQLNQLISQLEASTGAEMAIVTVPDTQPSASPKQFATELFNTWGIGKAGEDNGVLFLVSKGDRRTEVETGYGLEGLLPDAKVGRILDTQVTPQFKSGNFDAGILAGTQSIISAITGEAMAEPLPGRNALPVVPQNEPLNALPASPQPVASTPRPVAPSQPVSGALPGSIDQKANKVLNTILLLFLVAIVPVVIILKPLRTGRTNPIYIKPNGRSRLSKANGLSAYLWARGWATSNPHARWINGGSAFKLFKGKLYSETNRKLAAQSSWLETNRRNRQFQRVCITLVGLLSSTIVVTLGTNPGLFLLWALVVWGWLAAELWWSSKSTLTSRLISPLANTLRSLFYISACALLPLIVLAFISGGFSLLFSPLTLLMFCGTSAGLIRLFNAYEKGQAVLCKACDRPMELLTSTQLKHHLSKPEQVEANIGSKVHEGWQCQTCCLSSQNPSARNQSGTGALSIHVFSYNLKKAGFKKCKTCKALTLKVTSKTLKAATTYSSGRRRVTKKCHCCLEHSTKVYTISRKSSGSSSSYSGGYSSGSSSSSSGSSGGSFGGGSSGGGGAGSSW